MARIDTLDHFLTDVADAIREKKGTVGTIEAADFDEEIASISGGSSTHTIEGLDSYTINPIDAQYVTDDYKGTAKNDEYLVNCPSLSEVYTLFYDKYLNEDLANYTVTKQALGKDASGLYDLIEYDFCPAHWDRLILLTSGMNGYEVGAIFGLAYFLEDMVEHHEGDTLLTYLYEHVRIKVIPFVNPWGYTASPKSYINYNGVNLNRNFDDNDGAWERFDPQGRPLSNKGTAPFSEPESKILAKWSWDNAGAEFCIDCHTGLTTTNKELYSCTFTTSPIYSKVQSARTKISNWTKAFYGISTVNLNNRDNEVGYIRAMYNEKVIGIPTMAIEQCSQIDSIGLSKNGEAKSFINYTALIYGFVGELLLKADETVNSEEYIEELTQLAISNKKYFEFHIGEEAPKTLSSITAAKTKTSYAVDEQFSTSDVVVTATYSDSSTANVTSSATIGTVDTSTAGTKSLSISYAEGGVTKTTTISITVTSEPVVNYIDVAQGALDTYANGGAPMPDNLTRCYTTTYIPIPSDEPVIVKPTGDFWFSGRIYNSSDAITGTVSGTSGNDVVSFKNADEHSTAWGTAASVTLVKGNTIKPNANKIRLIFRTSNGSDNVSPSDLAGKTITVDGVEYTLRVQS